MAALLAVLDPDVVHRVDPTLLPPAAPSEPRGAQAVARSATFEIRRGRIVAMDVIADPGR